MAITDSLKLGSLIIMLLTDGNIGVYPVKVKKKTKISTRLLYFIRFYSNSRVLIDIVSDICKTLFELSPFFPHKSVVVFNSSNVVRELWNYSPSYRTRACSNYPQCPLTKGKSHMPCKVCSPLNVDGVKYPPARIPDFIFELSRDNILQILRLAMSCDGCVSICISNIKGHFYVEPMIFFTSFHPSIFEQIQKLFLAVGIITRVDGDSLVISRKEEVLKYIENVGFIDGVLIEKSKIFKGFTKSELMNKIPKIYNHPPSFWSSFSSKQEIFSFIKGL